MCLLCIDYPSILNIAKIKPFFTIFTWKYLKRLSQSSHFFEWQEKNSNMTIILIFTPFMSVSTSLKHYPETSLCGNAIERIYSNAEDLRASVVDSGFLV